MLIKEAYLGNKVVFHMESYFFEVQSSLLKPNSDPFVVTNGTLLSTRPLRYELETWSQQKRGEVGFLGTFGMGWSMVSSSPLALDSGTSMRN